MILLLLLTIAAALIFTLTAISVTGSIRGGSAVVILLSLGIYASMTLLVEVFG